MAFPAEWCRRKTHVVNQQVGAGVPYDVLIKVYQGAGVDGTEVLFGGLTVGKVYCGGNCRNDFGDIRFTKADGTTLETYWLEYYLAGNFAYFWVRISDDLGAGNVTIYVYYDAPTETTTSTNIMEDFTGYTVNDAQVTVTDAQHLIHHVNESDDEWAYTDKTAITHYWVQGKMKYVTDGVTDCFGFPCAISEMVDDRKYWIDNSRDFVAILQVEGTPTNGNCVLEKMNSGYGQSICAALANNTYYWYVLKRLGNTNTLYIYSDEAKTALVCSSNVTLGAVLRYLFAANVRNRGVASRIYEYSEDMYFRHTIDPEVTHGAWGAEEILVPADPTNLVAVCNGSYQVDLTWTDNATNETNYYVERNDGGWHVIATLPANSTTYSDNTIACDTNYLFRVRCGNACGYSNYVTLGVAINCPCPILECEDYDNQIDCEANGCCWYEGACYDCEEVPCGYWTNQVDCEANDCCWCDGVCQDCPCPEPPPPPPPPPTLCSDHVTQTDCETNGCCWCLIDNIWQCVDCPCPTIPCVQWSHRVCDSRIRRRRPYRRGNHPKMHRH